MGLFIDTSGISFKQQKFFQILVKLVFKYFLVKFSPATEFL